jgi:NAD(P)H dehydrogenase (quinone)
MKVLVVSAHPSPTSFLSTTRDAVLTDLVQSGHDVRHRDLYAEHFNPVFSAFERTNHNAPIAIKTNVFPELVGHIEDLQWCEALVLVYPTWWSAQPAMLKGWFDRVLTRDVAWELPEGAARIRPLLSNVKRLVVVTSHGSSKLVNAVQGESGKRIALRSVRLMLHIRTKTRWIGVYGMDNANSEKRSASTARVRRQVKRALA